MNWFDRRQRQKRDLWLGLCPSSAQARLISSSSSSSKSKKSSSCSDRSDFRDSKRLSDLVTCDIRLRRSIFTHFTTTAVPCQSAKCTELFSVLPNSFRSFNLQGNRRGFGLREAQKR